MNLAHLFRMGMINKGYLAPVNNDTGDAGDGGNGGTDNGTDSSDKAGEDEGEGGKAKPSEAEAKLLRDVMKKKEKIETLSSQNAEYSQRLQELEQRFDGIDPDDVKALREDLEKRRADDATRREQELEGKGDWKSLRAELEEKHQSQISQIVEQNKTKFQTQLEEVTAERDSVAQRLASQAAVIEELTVGNAFGTSQFVGEKLIPSPTKVRKLYGEHFDVVDGQVQAFDKPRGADKRHPLIDADGKPLNFETALQKIVDTDPDKDTILRATQRSGSGSDTNNRVGAEAQTVAKGLGRIQKSLNG